MYEAWLGGKKGVHKSKLMKSVALIYTLEWNLTTGWAEWYQRLSKSLTEHLNSCFRDDANNNNSSSTFWALTIMPGTVEKYSRLTNLILTTFKKLLLSATYTWGHRVKSPRITEVTKEQ